MNDLTDYINSRNKYRNYWSPSIGAKYTCQSNMHRNTSKRVISGSGDNRIDASGHNYPVLLFGDNGNDTLIGGVAPDRLEGGIGTDTCQTEEDDFIVNSCEVILQWPINVAIP